MITVFRLSETEREVVLEDGRRALVDEQLGWAFAMGGAS